MCAVCAVCSGLRAHTVAADEVARLHLRHRLEPLDVVRAPLEPHPEALLRVRVRVRGRVGLGLGLGLGLVLGLGFTLASAVLFRIASKEGESTPFSEASVSARVSATIWANLEPMEMFMALAYLVKG